MIKDRVKFFVNEEKKVVVCKYVYGSLYDLVDDVRKEFGYHVVDAKADVLHYVMDHASRYPNDSQLEAKATCSPNDKFSIKKGKKIAYNKLRQRLFKYLFTEASDLTMYYTDVLCDLAKQKCKAEDVITHYKEN